MKLSSARETYYYATGQISQITRQLALAGIAVVWLFKAGDGASFSLPDDLAIALITFIAALILDLLQYVMTAVIWGTYTWWKEKRFHRNDIDPSKDEPAGALSPPDAINIPALLLLGAKCMALSVGGYYLLRYLWRLQLPGVI